MRIVIKPSAREHLITDAEIRAVIGYPEVVVTRVARIPHTEPALFVGRCRRQRTAY